MENHQIAYEWYGIIFAIILFIEQFVSNHIMIKEKKMSDQKKKDWEKPELIVISKFNIEQTVLNPSGGNYTGDDPNKDPRPPQQ